jgi:hypothetical protein
MAKTSPTAPTSLARQRDRIFGPVQEDILLATRVCSAAQQCLGMPRQQIGKSLERTQCISSLCHQPVQIAMKLRRPTMSRDTFNVSGQAGAVGPSAHAHDNVFQQIQVGTGIDLPKLAEELERLRNAMKGESTGTPEHDEAIGAVAGAEKAAAKNDGLAALRYLKSAGTWALGENRRRTPYAA